MPFILPLYGDAALRDAFLDRKMYIIQHPGGKPKEVAQYTGAITLDAAKEFMQYMMDTEGGSSGSPVFNFALQVIALHHEYVPKRNGTKIFLKSGKLVTQLEIAQQKIPASQLECVSNKGVTITAIVADLIKKAPTFCAEHPEQYSLYRSLLMQDPLFDGSKIPPVLVQQASVVSAQQLPAFPVIVQPASSVAALPSFPVALNPGSPVPVQAALFAAADLHSASDEAEAEADGDLIMTP
jgi:endonuclease G